MKLKIGFIFVFSIWITKALATDQIYDVISYNDSTYLIFSRNIFVANNYPLRPLIQQLYEDTLSRHKVDSIIGATRWCTRGYFADWEIRNDSLILKNIERSSSNSNNPRIINLNYIFEDRNIQNGVFADWFSGLLEIMYIEPFVSKYKEVIAYIFIIENGTIKVKVKAKNATQ